MNQTINVNQLDKLINEINNDCNLNNTKNVNSIENCDSSFDYEEDVEFLQFDEDSLDIDEIVKATKVDLNQAEQCCSNNNFYENNNNEIVEQIELLSDEILEEF